MSNENYQYDEDGNKIVNKKLQNRFKNITVGVENKGSKIILPDDPHKMRVNEAITTLKSIQKAEETEVSIHEEINAYPLDGAFAFMQVLQQAYGWATAVPTPGFFGPTPPVMVNLEVGFGEHKQVIWGDFEIPNITGKLKTGATTTDDGRYIFCLRGTVLKKDQDQVKLIADAVRKYVLEGSVYKGKAIRLRTDSDGSFNPEKAPAFMDLSNVNVDELVYSDSIMEQVETNLFTPIKHTEVCRKHQVPLKRTILLEGPYGTGKTMAANVTAKHAEANGWTFIYLDRVQSLDEAVIFARQYAPAVVFSEDIDRVMTGGRSIKVDDILNNVDGVDSKNAEVICVLTTNHVEKIEKAMLRPGRFDAIINILPPDAEAAKKLMIQYGRGLLNEANLEEAGEELAGQIPAVIREAVERAKLYAIKRTEIADEEVTLTGADVAAAARAMKHHLDLLKENVEIPKTPAQVIGEAMEETMVNVVKGNFKKSEGKIEDMHKAIMN